MPDPVMAATAVRAEEVGAGHRNGPPVDPLTPLRLHPAFGVADLLAAHMGLDRDLVQFVEFLSLAAGRMVMPVNLDVLTDPVRVPFRVPLFGTNVVKSGESEPPGRDSVHNEVDRNAWIC